MKDFDLNEAKKYVFEQLNKLDKIDKEKFLQEVALKNYILLNEEDRKNIKVCVKFLSVFPKAYEYFIPEIFQNNEVIDKMVENIEENSSNKNCGFYIEKDYLKVLLKNETFKEHLFNIAEEVITKEYNNKIYIKISGGLQTFKSMYEEYEEKRKMREDLNLNKELKKHKLVKF